MPSLRAPGGNPALRLAQSRADHEKILQLAKAEQIAEHRAEQIDELKQQLDDATGRHDAELEKLRRQVAELTTQRDQIRTEHTELIIKVNVQEHTAATASASTKDLERSVAELKMQGESLRRDNDELKQHRHHRHHSPPPRHHHHDDGASLRDHMGELIREHNATLEAVRQHNATLAQQVRDLIRDKETSELKTELTVRGLRDSNERAGIQRDTLAERLAMKDEKIEDLKSRLTMGDVTINSQYDGRETLRVQVHQELEIHNTKLIQQNEQLIRQNAGLTEQLTELKTRHLEVLEQRNHEAEHSTQLLEARHDSQVQELERRNAKLLSENDTLTEQLTNLKTRLHELELECSAKDFTGGRTAGLHRPWAAARSFGPDATVGSYGLNQSQDFNEIDSLVRSYQLNQSRLSGVELVMVKYDINPRDTVWDLSDRKIDDDECTLLGIAMETSCSLTTINLVRSGRPPPPRASKAATLTRLGLTSPSPILVRNVVPRALVCFAVQ